MKATAVAPANIAFIKYWGKKDDALRIPANASISMNLSGATTTTTVEFSHGYSKDIIQLMNGKFSDIEKKKIIVHLDRIRAMAKLRDCARVVTKNSFPRGVGAASSASGFAALTVAANAAAGLTGKEKDLTVLARIGSGSACRSIPDGFVKWVTGNSSAESYAYSLHPSDYWDVRDVLVIVDSRQKTVSTTRGMERASTSPFWNSRIDGINERISRVEHGLNVKSLREVGEATEEDCLSMHAVAMTQRPPVFYWNETTQRLIGAVTTWRKEGLPVYFTIDAGPNVHLICEAKDEKDVILRVKPIGGIKEIITNKPSKGAHIVKEHLF